MQEVEQSRERLPRGIEDEGQFPEFALTPALSRREREKSGRALFKEADQ